MDIKYLHRDYGLTRHGGGAEFTGKRLYVPEDLQADLRRFAGGQYTFMTEIVDRRSEHPQGFYCLVPEQGGDYLVAGPTSEFIGCTTDVAKVRRVISKFFNGKKGRKPQPSLEAQIRA